MLYCQEFIWLNIVAHCIPTQRRHGHPGLHSSRPACPTEVDPVSKRQIIVHLALLLSLMHGDSAFYSVSLMFMWFCVFISLRRLSWITIARFYSDLTFFFIGRGWNCL